jgi:uncharacterized membrane protein
MRTTYKGEMMLGRIPKPMKLKLDVVVCKLLDDMIDYGPDSPEYPMLLQNLEKVSAIQDNKSKTKLDPNTVLSVAGTLLGILTMVAYEQKHVMTSKTLGFLKFR